MKRICVLLALLVFFAGGTCEPPPPNDPNDPNPPPNGPDGNVELPEDSEFLAGADQTLTLAGTWQPVKIVLPAGTNLDISQLKVQGLAKETAVAADGAVALPQLDTPFISVVDGQNRVIFLGYRGNSTENIDATSTATALLYYALGGYTLPADDWFDGIFLFKFNYTDIRDQLVAAIESAMAKNPTALHDGDAEILDALETARKAILALPPPKSINDRSVENSSPNPFFDRKSEARSQSQPAGGGFVTISPDRREPQSGMYILDADLENPGAVKVVNTLPRRGKAYIFKTAYVDQEGTEHAISPPELVDLSSATPAAENPIDILAASAADLSGSFGAGGINVQQRDALDWEDETSQPFALSVGESETEAHYEVVILGAALDQAGEPAVFSEPKYVLQRDQWRADLEQIQLDTFVDIMVPVVQEFTLGTRVRMGFETRAALAAAIEEIIEPIIAENNIQLTNAEKFALAARVVLEEIVQDTELQVSFVEALLNSLGPDNMTYLGGDPDLLGRRLRAIAANRSVAEGVVTAAGEATLANVIEHLKESKAAEVWEVSIARLRITPAKPYLDPRHTKIRLNAVLADSSGEYCYRWTTDGQFGTLLTPDGSGDGTDVRTDSATIEYLVPPNDVIIGEMDEVTVTAYDVSEVSGGTDDCESNVAQGEQVGTATVTVEGRNRIDACEGTEFPLDKYNTSEYLNIYASPQRVMPGDTVTVFVTYNGPVPSDPDDPQPIGTVYLPLAGYFCFDGFAQYDGDLERYVCGSGRPSDEVLVDGVPAGPSLGASVSLDYPFLGEGKPGIFLNCIWTVRLTFGSGGNSHTISYKIEDDWPPCAADREGCYCPYLYYRDPSNISFDPPSPQHWFLTAAVAQEGTAGSDGAIAIELIDMEVDLGFDLENYEECPEE